MFCFIIPDKIAVSYVQLGATSVGIRSLVTGLCTGINGQRRGDSALSPLRSPATRPLPVRYPPATRRFRPLATRLLCDTIKHVILYIIVEKSLNYLIGNSNNITGSDRRYWVLYFPTPHLLPPPFPARAMNRYVAVIIYQITAELY